MHRVDWVIIAFAHTLTLLPHSHSLLLFFLPLCTLQGSAGGDSFFCSPSPSELRFYTSIIHTDTRWPMLVPPR
ncbi:hypothetical protein BKA82DRAFT_873073 [Pisolithus tinctorius]|uniref:Secreted protein n=1 Tax=Pisolithus tinctorius Marx 270 TaxID=870435 RepID=A0A0C3PP89_PISTI|nr:hypothetical protein BKA82DRAFT_873073 [Pisolithus tinctorius]KIO10726.1 hypothetical protein M404DRAFT_873073 [Pisolithus tinctorius Marx 270]